MSDTDDTDSLLSVAAPSGLTSFLGLTVEQMSTHINALTSNNEGEVAENHCETEEGERQEEELCEEGILDELGEWSDSDNDLQDDEERKDGSGSEASTASTNSVTLVVPAEKKKNDIIDEGITECERGVPNTTTTTTSSNNNAEVSVRVEDANAASTLPPMDRPLEFNYNKYKSPNYGVRVYSGLEAHGMSLPGDSPNTAWRYQPGSEKDPQIATRAPNFRTPGGYKPCATTSKPRDLTDAQIQEELRLMYAFPEAEEEQKAKEKLKALEENKDTGQQAPQKGDGDSDKINGNDVNNALVRKIEGEVIRNPEVELTEKSEGNAGVTPPPAADSGKIVKRKLFSAGDNAGSIPDLGFGLRDFEKLEVRENPVAPSRAWNTEESGQAGVASSRKDRPNVSFAQFRDENNVEISPIKAASSGSSAEKNAFNEETNQSVAKYRPSQSNVIPSPRKVNLLELDLLWRDIRSTKERMEEDIQKSSDRLKSLTLGACSREPKSQEEEEENTAKAVEKQEKSYKAPHRSSKQDGLVIPGSSSSSAREKQSSSVRPKVPSQGQRKSPEVSKATDVSFDFSTTSDDLPSMSLVDASLLPTDLDTLDLSSILSAAQLKTSEFEEILEKLEDVTDETFEEIKTADDEIENILEKLQISDWAKTGAGDLLQKYQEEKFKREHCEREIAQLQSLLLKMQEESVVRDKVMSKKDAVLLKMTRAWSEMTKQWKAHEAQTKEVLEKLQKRQKVLAESLRHSRSRIEEYERELAGAVELAQTFKSKLDALELAKEEEVEKLELENNALKDQFGSLQNNLQYIKIEKDAAVRALSESQKQLDDRIALHTEMQEKLQLLEVEAHEGQKDLVKVAEQKKVLEEHLQSVTVQKDSLENQVSHLSEELKTAVEEKERLKMSLQAETERQIREESDRLHAYYNEKLQEALQLQAQKMIAAESQIVDDHQRQLSELEREMMRKIKEVKNRCLNETSKMKSRYEKELRALRDEVAQKQQFISTLSIQLQSFVRSEGGRSRAFEAFPGNIIGEGSGHSLVGSVKNGSDICVSSSTESTIEETTTKFRVHHRSTVADDGNASSAEDFHPSKLSRYNTSTPNSAVGTPCLKGIKGWRELPDIKHILQRSEDHPTSNVNSISDVSKLKTLFPTATSAMISESYVEGSKKLNGEIPGILEESVQRYVQSLVKSYSGGGGVHVGVQDDVDNECVRLRSESIKDSTLFSSKQFKDNTNSIINSERLGETSKVGGGAGGSSRVATALENGSHSQRITKHSQKPPWK